LQCLNDQERTLTVSANVVGLGTTTTGIGTHRFSVAGQVPGSERTARFHSDYSSGTGAYTFSTLNKDLDSTIKSLVRVSCGETSAIHQLIGMRDIDDVLTVQYPFVSAGSTTGIGTFGGEISGSNINIKFYPDAEYSSSLTEVQSFNQVLYTTNDFDNTPPVYRFGEVEKRLFLSAYDGLNGNRANKTDFDLTHENTPIYTKTFNPTNTGILSTTTGIFTIDNHFYNTGEELEYTPGSTIIGLAATAVSIASTTNSAGVVTTILPTKVFPKVINERQFQLFSRVGFLTLTDALPVTFTGTGSGNAHKLNITKKLAKTVIGLDGIVQQPITYTSIQHNLDGAIGVGITQFILSGISSIQPRDVLKIDNEFMKVDQVGFTSVQNGFINDSTAVALGIATLPVVRVQRGSLGIGATPHSDNAAVRVHRGSFNIVDSKVYFLDPPKGNTRSRRADDNLPFVRAEFSGRTFLRSNYTTNMVFDDVSDNFTGIGRTYTLTVGGGNTSIGVGIGNGVLFINGVFQTPRTVNNTGNNYEFENDTTAGISSVVFTGISSVNGDYIKSDFDINQNQLPRGGLIVSLGSTPGLGYAPLIGAEVKPKINAEGSLTSLVGIGTSIGALAKVPANSRIGIQTAVYDHIAGIITVTTTGVHGFSLETPSMVKLRDLEFTCAAPHTGVTTTFFQDHERPLHLVGIISERTFEVDAGICTIPHNYKTGGNAWEFFNDLTFGSGYYGTVAIGVSDIEYDHKFVSSTNNSITPNAGAQLTPTASNYTSSTGRLSLTVGSHSLSAATKHKVDSAQYDARVGIMTVTIAGHGFSNGNFVKFADNSLTFKCSMDANATEHSYPRSSDPVSNKWLAISNKTANTFRVNVGTSQKAVFTPTGADYDPTTGLMELEIGAHSLKAGSSIKLVANSLGFTCDVDNNATTKTYPRSSDPVYNTAIKIQSVTDTSITLQVLTAIPSTNTTKHTFVSASAGAVISGGEYVHAFHASATDGLLRAVNTVQIANNSLGFTCSRDNHRGTHLYPRTTDPASGQSLGVEEVNSEAIVVNVGSGGGGGTGAVVSAKAADNKHKFVSATVGAAFTGGNYAHIFVAGSENTNAVSVQSGAENGNQKTPNGATYNAGTGILVLSFASNHGMSTNDVIRITDNSITFTCDRDKHLTEHTYPRPTDPASVNNSDLNTGNLAITKISNTSFSVFVGKSPIVTRNISDADYDPATGWIQVESASHGFVGCSTITPTNAAYNKNTGVLTLTKNSHGFNVGDKILIDDNGITFTCTKDGGATEHSYPRPTDYASGKWLEITNKTVNTFKVNVNPNPSYQKFDHTFVPGKTVNGCIQKSNQTVGIATGSLVMSCAKDAYTTDHAYPRVGFAHSFSSALPNSVTVTGAANRTITGATYDGTTGDLVLDFGAAHGLNTSNTVGIITGGLTLTCERDNYATLHPYPRVTDPIHNNSTVPIRSVTSNTITIRVGTSGEADLAHRVELPVGRVGSKWFRVNVGKSPAGTGGALDININEVGGNYVNPLIVTPDPVYQNLPVIGVSRLGIGNTTETGKNMLVSASVSAAQTTTGIGATGFGIYNFKVTRDGHSFNVGDKFKPVGLVTAANLQRPLDDFQLEVVQTYNDYFSAWQFGEIDFIDNIKLLQDGSRRRFPLFLNGQLISFEKDNNDALSSEIDLDAVLIIFVNGVIQTPKIAYQFAGGTTVLFTEPPSPSDKIDIFFYVGQRGVDIEIVDVQESVKVGDDLRLLRHPGYTDTVDQERTRIIKSFLGSDIVETDTYVGVGITEDQEKPIQWTKQKVDKIIQGEVISKARSNIEAQIYPTAKIIGDLTTSSGIGGAFGIFVDDAESFYYEDEFNPALDGGDRYGIGINAVDALIVEGDTSLVGAAFTAVVSAAGTIQSVTTTNVGSGYTAGPIHINFAAPQSVGVGVGTTAFAKATITNGSVSSVSIENIGLGYTFTNPPHVITQQPQNLTERINTIENVEGYTGVITGITTSNGIGGHLTALRFFFRADKTANSLLTNYPILISDTTVGHGVTSVHGHNNSVVSVGTTFLDNIYIVNSITSSGENGEIVCNVKNGSSIAGIAITGFHNPSNLGLTTSLGRLSWGRLYNGVRGTTPISIGVTGFTVNSGLTTFPTIQRRNFKDTSLKGLRSTGSLRVFGLP